MTPVEIVCHRGANAHAPENTYAAAQLCLEWGVEYLEIDVRTSKDGIMYLLHDPKVDRTTNGSGAIADLLAAEIDTLDAGGWFSAAHLGQRVPRLEPFLEWLDGRIGVFFDVKDADLDALVSMVRQHGLADGVNNARSDRATVAKRHRSFFWFPQDSDALALRKLAPDLALKMNACTVADVIRADEIFGASIIEVSLADLSRAIVEACKRRGLRLMIYERGADHNELARALASGADMLNTNHGDIALALREQMAAGPGGERQTSRAGSSGQYDLDLHKPSGGEGHEPVLSHASHVLLVMFDGCRPDALTPADAPNLHALMAEGAYTLDAKTVMPSITLPCHTSLFYSLPPEEHGVVTNEWSALPGRALPVARKLGNGATSMVEVFSDYGYSTAAFHTWEHLRDLSPPGTLDLVYYRRLSEEAFEDVVAKAMQSISAHAPNFAFVYLEGTDAMGHRHGWMSPEYRAAVRRQDEIVGELLARYRELGIEQKTLVVVMADHGGHDHGHGTAMPEDITIPVIFRGPAVRPGHQIVQPVSIVDVAPTILSHMGLPIPRSWTGKILDNILAPSMSNP